MHRLQCVQPPADLPQLTPQESLTIFQRCIANWVSNWVSNLGGGRFTGGQWGSGNAGGGAMNWIRNWFGKYGGNNGGNNAGNNGGYWQWVSNGNNVGGNNVGVFGGNVGSGACSPQESLTIFQRCIANFANSMGRNMQQFVNSQQCPRQLFNCQAATQLLTCANTLSRNDVSDACFAQMPTELTKGFRKYGINCSYQDVHAQCAGAWTGPLLQPSQRPNGNGPVPGNGFGNMFGNQNQAPQRSGYGK